MSADPPCPRLGLATLGSRLLVKFNLNYAAPYHFIGGDLERGHSHPAPAEMGYRRSSPTSLNWILFFWTSGF